MFKKSSTQTKEPPVSVKNIKKAKKKNKPAKVRGLSDVLPRDEEMWKFLWNAIHTLSELHDYHLIETPPLELERFVMPVFSKMSDAPNPLCSVKLPNGESATLSPVPELGVIRSYCDEHLGYYASPLKVFHKGPVFRHVKGGKEISEFYEYGFEIVGESNDPIYDGQLILTALDFVKILKIKGVALKVSSLGCKSCRGTFRDNAKSYYNSHKAKLCSSCSEMLETGGPLQRFLCEEEKCKLIHSESPTILDYMCHGCNNHFKTVLEILEENEVAYEPDPRLTRAFPFYNRTVFEIWAQGNILGVGGRYDYLSEMMRARSVPGAGVSFFVDSLFAEIKSQQISTVFGKTKPKTFFIAVGEQARRGSLKIINDLRMHGMPVIESLGKKSLKAQLKAAEKSGAKFALILGQREVFEGTVIFRDLITGAQETLVAKSVVEEIKKRCK